MLCMSSLEINIVIVIILITIMTNHPNKNKMFIPFKKGSDGRNTDNLQRQKENALIAEMIAQF